VAANDLLADTARFLVMVKTSGHRGGLCGELPFFSTSIMQYITFLHEAKAAFNVATTDEVTTVSRAVLHTLTDHLAGNAADNLAAQFPAELRAIVHEISPEDRDRGERFKLTEFFERVANRAGVDTGTGERYTREFVRLLGRMVTAGELHKIKLTLPDDYDHLFADVTGLDEAPQHG
jgi:uncharacterized protein (DUF2267 family)